MEAREAHTDNRQLEDLAAWKSTGEDVSTDDGGWIFRISLLKILQIHRENPPTWFIFCQSMTGPIRVLWGKGGGTYGWVLVVWKVRSYQQEELCCYQLGSTGSEEIRLVWMVFEGSAPFQTVSVSSFQGGHVRYILPTCKTFHLMCQVGFSLSFVDISFCLKFFQLSSGSFSTIKFGKVEFRPPGFTESRS